MQIPDFPNGFDSWQKTHFEVVEVLCYLRGLEEGKKPMTITEMEDRSATEELYKLALDLTHKYESLMHGQQRTRGLFDEIEDFVWTELQEK